MPNVGTVLQGHARNAYIAAALDQDREFVRAKRIREEAKHFTLAPVPRRPSPLDSDDVTLADWLEGSPEVIAQEQAREAKLRALDRLVANAERDIVAAVELNGDALLAHLAAPFTEVLDEARDLADKLKGARTPVEALNLEVEKTWRALRPVLDRYNEVREAQRIILSFNENAVTTSKSLYVQDPLASDTQIANLDEVFPNWRRPPTANSFGDVVDERPWPTAPTDPVEILVWLVSSNARPWVPTISELAQLHQTRREARDFAAMQGQARHDGKELRLGKLGFTARDVERVRVRQENR